MVLKDVENASRRMIIERAPEGYSTRHLPAPLREGDRAVSRVRDPIPYDIVFFSIH